MSDNIKKYTSEFWKKNSPIDLIKEIVKPNDVDVSSIKFNDTLSPIIWDGENMKPEIRKVLLLNAKTFIENSDLGNIKFHDIILTGSMANYNYNEDSDLDVHIVLDFSQISDNEDFVTEFLKMKKVLWNDTYPVQIEGHDVEMYYQNISEAHYSTGTYSIYNNEWLSKPIKKIININIPDIQAKTANLMNDIDNLNKINDLNVFLKKYTNLKNKIKKMRRSGLKEFGEFSPENLAFKILRNSDYLGKLVKLKNKMITKNLSY